MHGTGKFQHRDGFVIEPVFSNNLAMIEGDFFINPYLTKQETEDYLKRITRKESDEIKAEKAKQEKISLHRVHNLEDFHKVLS